MNKMKHILFFLLCTYFMYGVEYTLQLGLSPFRETYIRENGVLEVESPGYGIVSLGAEGLWKTKNIRYGAGFELKNEIKHNRNFFTNRDSSYFTNPFYGVVKYHFPKDYYALGRLGLVVNKGELVNDLGRYVAFGVGKSLGSFDLELLYEGSELKNSGNLLVNKDDWSHSGIFFDGALDEITFKVAYAFGRGAKPEPPKVIEKIVEVIKVEEKPAVPEVKLENPTLLYDEKVYTNAKLLPNAKVSGNEGDMLVTYSYKLEKIYPESEILVPWIGAVSSKFYVLPKNLEDGKYRISVIAYKATKVSEISTREFEIDSKGPKIDLLSTLEGAKPKWNWKLDEANSVVTEVRLNGVLVKPTSLDTFDNGKEYETGRYTLSVKAKDINGNESIEENSVVVVKTKDVAERKLLEDFSKGLASLPVIVGYKVNITQLTTEQEKRVMDAIKVLDGLDGTLSVVGYTDDTGTEKLNLKLSKDRAGAVASMVKKLVKNPKEINIETVGRGETSFKVPNTSEDNRRLNRRIEFEFRANNGEVIESVNKTKY